MSRPQPTDLYASVADLVAEAVAVYGVHASVDCCLALLDGASEYHLLPLPLTFLAGVHAEETLDRGDLVARGQDFWPRVWAARGLRHVWLDYAEPGVHAALSDPSWRVREMAAKVTRTRSLRTAADVLAELVYDPEPRVAVAAAQALGELGERRHADQLALLAPDDTALRVAVAGARRALRVRTQRALR